MMVMMLSQVKLLVISMPLSEELYDPESVSDPISDPDPVEFIPVDPVLPLLLVELVTLGLEKLNVPFYNCYTAWLIY